jgi:hypothetical protein
MRYYFFLPLVAILSAAFILAESAFTFKAAFLSAAFILAESAFAFKAAFTFTDSTHR